MGPRAGVVFTYCERAQMVERKKWIPNRCFRPIGKYGLRAVEENVVPIHIVMDQSVRDVGRLHGGTGLFQETTDLLESFRLDGENRSGGLHHHGTLEVLHKLRQVSSEDKHPLIERSFRKHEVQMDGARHLK